jgi:Rieske Fe-S protein
MRSEPKPCRRQFVKTLMFGTAASVLFGRPWRATVLAAPQPSAGAGVFRVRVSDYPPLQLDYGSVRLGFNPIDLFGPLGAFYPIIINRESPSTYYALDSFCSHAGCVVPPFDEAEGAIRCLCHGSAYALDGSLINGPASNPLIRYPATFDGVDTLSIEIPGLAYSVTGSVVQSGDSSRFQLDFPTFEGVEYEVQFRQRVRDSWSPILFALAIDGPADQSSLIGNGSPATVFVDRTTPTGFYTVSIKIIDLT